MYPVNPEQQRPSNKRLSPTNACYCFAGRTEKFKYLQCEISNIPTATNTDQISGDRLAKLTWSPPIFSIIFAPRTSVSRKTGLKEL